MLFASWRHKQLRILALESPGGTYDENFLSNYFYNNLRPAILRIQGVGKCEVWGGQYALRIWLKPEAMARYGVVPSDVTALLEEQNVEASIGSIGENTPARSTSSSASRWPSPWASRCSTPSPSPQRSVR